MNNKEVLRLSDGSKITKNLGKFSRLLKLRNEALKKRTIAEMWAEREIRILFKSHEFNHEHIFKYRRFDFFFFSSRIALEIDGSYHSTKFYKMYDVSSDDLLFKKYNITVYRVNNFDKINLLRVLNKIRLKTIEIPLKKGMKKKRVYTSYELNYLNADKKRVQEKVIFEPKFILRKKHTNY